MPDLAGLGRSLRVFWAMAAVRWRSLMLARPYMSVVSLTVVADMLVIGRWVAAQIEMGVIRNTAAAPEMAARRYQNRARPEVACDIGELPDNIPAVLRNCLYRFAQEGRSNTIPHAGGFGQRLAAHADDPRLDVSGMDSGPGIDATRAYEGVGGQGLMGLRGRIEAFGGTLEISNQTTGGACLAVRFDPTMENVPNA